MNTITQTPQPIGPAPRNVCVDEAGPMKVIMLGAMAFTILWHYMLVRQSEKLVKQIRELLDIKK